MLALLCQVEVLFTCLLRYLVALGQGLIVWCQLLQGKELKELQQRVESAASKGDAKGDSKEGGVERGARESTILGLRPFVCIAASSPNLSLPF